MFTRKRFGIGVCAGVAALALALAGPWRQAVWAELGLSNVIHVEIFSPTGIDLLVYTPDADIPDWFEVGVASRVEPEALRGDTLDVDDIDSVVTALGGELDPESAEITDELFEVEATLVNQFGDDTEYLAIVDLTELEFESITRGSPGVFASDVIRTVAIVDGYYNNSRTVRDIVEGDAIEVAVEIRDAAEIDNDGNGFPDATALLSSGGYVLYGSNGVVTLVIDLDSLGRGTTEAIVDHYYESQFGPVLVSVESPTLEALQLADDSFDVFNVARLIISISENADDLIDSPSGFNPVSDFDLVDSNDEQLPPPQNLFVRAVIAVTSAARGSIPEWTFVGDLPGGLELIGELSGPGVAELLEDGTDVDFYSYSITMTQDDEDIEAESDDDSEWAEADNVQVSNQDTEDDEEDSRDAVQADDGDDTVRAEFSLGSAIFGSNVAPRVGGGGGGSDGSGCFIATAAYGTPLALEIQSLRDVRDAYLINTALGTAFADAYYRISPPIARLVSEYPVAKTVVRAALAPVVTLSGWTLTAPGAVAAGAAALILGLFFGLRGIRRA